MTQQLALDLSPPRARRRDPETSKRAAEQAGSFVASHEGKIFGALHNAGDQGSTYRDIAQAAGLEPVAVARRLRDMEKRGLIERRIVPAADTEHGDYRQRNGMCVWWKA